MAEVQADRAFVQFKSLEYGWRAAFHLLTRTYYHKYRLYTIRTIIRRWAPSSENDTSAYIANVSASHRHRPRRADRHPFGQALALDGSRRSNGDSGEWNNIHRLVRYAEGVGTMSPRSMMFEGFVP